MPHIRKLFPPGAVFFVVLAAFAQRSETYKTLKLDIDLVFVNVSVTTANNAVVTGLGRDNFQVFEDRVEQEIRSISTDGTPLSLGIIFDISQSMGKRIQLAREAAVTFLEGGSAEDEYFLVEFNSQPRLAQSFTSDILRLQNRLSTLPPVGRTAMYDALYLGLSEVKKGQNPKKALLLITDGEDNHSRYSRQDIREFVRESDVPIYSIDLGRALIGDLSEMTGGHSYRISVDEMRQVCEKIAEELKSQYVIGYVSTNTSKDGQFRKLRVKVNPPSGTTRLNVRAREGYYAPRQ